MANITVRSQQDRTWPQVNSRPLITGAVLVGVGAMVAAAGLAVVGFHLISATRAWARDLEVPPREFARLKWEQARTAAASGASTWREHPHAKVHLVRRPSS